MGNTIKVRGAGRSKGIPSGYIMGRSSGGTGDVELLKLNDLRRMGVASHQDVAANVPGPTGVTPGSYTLASITVQADGRLTAASSGVAPVSAIVPLSSGDSPGSFVFGNKQFIGVPYSLRVDAELCPVYLASGLSAAKPIPPPVVAGATAGYLATDTSKFFVWTGSAWTQIN